MICVSVAEPTVKACLRVLEGVDFAEVRLDKMMIGVGGVKRIFGRHPRLIATCRPGGMSEDKRRRLLLAAIETGAAFVDIELEAAERFKERLVRSARAAGCRVIISYHNADRTPSKADLEETIRRSFASGADIAKIACRVRTGRENARLLGLLDGRRRLVVVGMGKKGRLCRIVAPLLGSRFTYASPGEGKETAEGQLNELSLKRILLELKSHAGD